MKNHIVFKFLAVILCAACLLGAVGSGIGILVLTELDLYNSDPQTRYTEELYQMGQNYADTMLENYVSRTLGNFPEEAIYLASDFGTYRPFAVGSYNYQLLDSQGNVLEDATGNELKEPIAYEWNVPGTYRRVVDVRPVEEEPTLEEAEPAVVIDNIPAGATLDVYGRTVSNGNIVVMTDNPHLIGTITHTPEGLVVYQALEPDRPLEDMWLDQPATDITFYDVNGEILYSATCTTGVGDFSYIDDRLQFQSYFASQGSQTVGTEVNNLPVGKNVTVAGIKVGWDGGETELNFYELGYLCRYDDGTVGFSATSFDAFDETPGDPVTDICFTDADGDILYSASSPDGVGHFFYNARNGYCFQSTVVQTEQISSGTVNTYVNVYEMPTLTSSVCGSLGIGYRVEDIQVHTVNEVEWGYIPDMGWVLMDQITLDESGLGRSADDTTETFQIEAVPESAQTGEAAPAADTGETPVTSTEPTLATEPVAAVTQGEEPDSSQCETVDYWDSETQQYMRIYYTLETRPDYTFRLYLEDDLTTYFPYYNLLKLLCSVREELYTVLMVSVLGLALLAVYLCCAAGRKPGTTEIHPGGLNAMPLDLSLAVTAGIGFGLGALILLYAPHLLGRDMKAAVGFGAGLAYVISLAIVGFCFAFAAQVKTPGGYWWRNTLCVQIPLLCLGICRWAIRLLKRFFPWLGRCLGWCWNLVKKVWNWAWGLVKKAFVWIWGKIDGFLKLLPLTWQWILAGGAMFLLLIMAVASGGLMTILCLAGCVAIILYGAHCFGLLSQSAKRMSKGDLDIQVEDPWMLGSFQEFAQDLNGLAGVAVVAAQKQLKSERMKTELITNVSHDIKTPLTSIINYVDLLQKPHTEEEGKQYLEVLDRQSQRLKKLIEDLMEMSKASTGNMSVDIKPLDAKEAINQALGEFADKLTAAQLVPVFRRPETPVTMLADGRLTWRVLSNLLGNAVKYALPGTRLYIDLVTLEGKVVLSLKNISREELNVEADELLERFVRGDSSRNTEGSGLGLNIAQSLMELQKGSLQLLVDGDLFKVTLIFPAG